MVDFVYVVTFEYDDEYEVVGAARTRKDAEEYIEKIRGKKLFDNEQIKLTEFILKKLPQTCKKVKINNKVSKVKAGTIDKIFAEGLMYGKVKA